MFVSSKPLRRVLVTGARGFLGRQLVLALHGQGVHVTAFVRGANALPGAMRIVEGDLLDGARLGGLLAADVYDAIFHLAGVNASAGSAALYQANVVGTATLLGAVRDLDRPDLRVVLLGSSAEYGAASDDPITEESVPAPVGDYGVSKLAVTRMGQLLYAGTEQATIMVRPFNVIGPGPCADLLHAHVARDIAEIEAGRRSPQLELGYLGAYRDFVDLRDVAAGLIALAEYGKAGAVYNLCTEKAVQTAALVEALVIQAGLAITVKAGAAPRRFSDVPYQRGSFRKALHDTGWAPRVSLEKSLTDTLNYWRKCAHLAPSGGLISEAIPE